MLRILTTFLFLAPSLAFGWNRGVHFYVSPESPFPSGQANLVDLEKSRLKEHQRIQFLGERQNLKFWLSPDEVARDLDVSFRMLDLKSKKILWLISTAHGTATVFDESSQQTTTMDIDDLAPLPDDLGVALPIVATPLRESPQWKSVSISRADVGERLRILRITDEWTEVAFVSNPSVKGWVPLSGLLTKFDFASHALPIDGKWTNILYRKGLELVTADESTIPLDKVKAIITHADKGISLRAIDHLDLPARAHMKLIKPTSKEWIESNLAGHGRVFWKKTKDDVSLSELKKDFLLSSDSMMKRQITSMAVHPQQPQMGLISADGVFISHDGFIWELLPMFEKMDYPVAVGTNGDLFVGPYRSKDQGKTFHPYLKWDQISNLSAAFGGQKQHPILQLTKIEALSNDRIVISLNNGLKNWKVEGDGRFGLVHQWAVLK